MRWTAWSTTAACLLTVATRAAPAAADPEVIYPPPRVSVFADLTFVRDRGASICPGEQDFKDALGADMEEDSFAPNPRGVYVGRVRVVLSRAPGSFTAAYTWQDAQGEEHQERYTEPGTAWYHCQVALKDVALSLSIRFTVLELELGGKYAAKDAQRAPPPYCPAALPSPTSSSAPCPPVTRFDLWPPELPIPPLRAPEPDPPKPPQRAPLALRFGATVWPELIATGWGSVGISVEAGVRYRAFSVGAEVHGDPPLGAVSFPNVGEVSFARLSGALLLCAHIGWFAGCGAGDAGRFLFPNHVHALPDSVFYGAAGVRAGLEFPVAPPRLFLRVGLDVRAPIHPASYSTAHGSIFEAAGPSGGVGLGVLTELPL
jgi:hypothetical protein